MLNNMDEQTPQDTDTVELKATITINGRTIVVSTIPISFRQFVELGTLDLRNYLYREANTESGVLNWAESESDA